MVRPSRLAAESGTGGASSRMTWRIASALMTPPFGLKATTWKRAPLSLRETFERVILDIWKGVLAPCTSTPSRCHWRVRGAAPTALTEKVAVEPWITVRLAGWVGVLLGVDG